MEKDLSQRIKFPPKVMEVLKPKARTKAKATKASYQAISKPTIGKRRQREETSAPSKISSKKPKTDEDLNVISDTDTWKDFPSADNSATNESSSESQTLPLPPPPEGEDAISTFEDAVLAMKKRQRKQEEELEQRALKILMFLICMQKLDWNRQESFTEGGLRFGCVTNNIVDGSK
jgi:hypothetical protein